MKVMFKLPWSDHVKERGFPISDWKHPVPRKDESVKLYATYMGDRAGLKLIDKGKLTLCHFMVTRVTYQEDVEHVDIELTFVVPVLRD